MKKSVKVILISLISIIVLGGIAFGSYLLFFKEDPKEVFKKSVDSLINDLSTSFESVPLMDLDTYELFGRLKVDSDEEEYTFDYTIRTDRKNKNLDVEYKYLNDDNSLWYSFNNYMKGERLYISYPDFTDKIINMESLYDEEYLLVENPLDLEYLGIAKYWIKQVECVKQAIDDTMDDNEVIRTEETIKIEDKDIEVTKLSYKMDKELADKYFTLGGELFYSDNTFVEYLMNLYNQSEEEVLTDLENEDIEIENAEVIVYIDSNDNVLKIECLTNNSIEMIIEKRSNTYYLEIYNEDNDKAVLEFGELYFKMESNSFYEGDIVNALYEIKYDSITKNRAAGDINLTYSSINKNDTFITTINGNFTLNSKDVELKVIDKTYDYEDLEYEELLNIYDFFMNMDDNPTT